MKPSDLVVLCIFPSTVCSFDTRLNYSEKDKEIDFGLYNISFKVTTSIIAAVIYEKGQTHMEVIRALDEKRYSRVLRNDIHLLDYIENENAFKTTVSDFVPRDAWIGCIFHVTKLFSNLTTKKILSSDPIYYHNNVYRNETTMSITITSAGESTTTFTHKPDLRLSIATPCVIFPLAVIIVVFIFILRRKRRLVDPIQAPVVKPRVILPSLPLSPENKRESVSNPSFHYGEHVYEYIDTIEMFSPPMTSPDVNPDGEYITALPIASPRAANSSPEPYYPWKSERESVGQYVDSEQLRTGTIKPA